MRLYDHLTLINSSFEKFCFVPERYRECSDSIPCKRSYTPFLRGPPVLMKDLTFPTQFTLPNRMNCGPNAMRTWLSRTCLDQVRPISIVILAYESAVFEVSFSAIGGDSMLLWQFFGLVSTTLTANQCQVWRTMSVWQRKRCTRASHTSRY